MFTDIKIVTNRLSLHPLVRDDMEELFRIACEKKSIEDFQYVAHCIDDVKSWLEPSLCNSNVLTWVIRKQERIIGLFEVSFEAEYSDIKTNICRVGYFIDCMEHNQGFGTEVLKGVVDWLFKHTDVERIEAGVTLNNIPSNRILEKVGFIRELIIKSNWRWYDQVYDSAYYYLSKPSSI